MAYHFFFTSIYPVLQKPCLRAPTLWFLFMQLNNESVWCSTWVESPNWVRGSWAKMLSDFKKCKVHWIETKSCQSRYRSKWECKKYNRTPQKKWSDCCIFITQMKWKLREYIYSKNNQHPSLRQRHKDNQIFHVLVDRGREWGSAGYLLALEERNTNKAR